MLKEQMQKIVDMVKIKDGDNNKRKIENLVVFIVILVITIIMINSIWNTNKKQSDNSQIDTGKILAKKESENESYQVNINLEEKLKNILSKIDGVGKVDVLITYSESSKVLAMYNEDNTTNDTEEKDVQGGNRKISQISSKKEVIYQEVNGEKVPATQSIVDPKMEGAIVTAVGANSSTVKTNIVQAVGAVTGLPTHKIQVFEMAN